MFLQTDLSKLKIGKNEDSWDLVKNDKYYDKDKVKLNKVHYKIVKDSQTAVNMYESKDTDMTGLTPENIKKYKNSKDFYTKEDVAVYFLRLNKTHNKALDNEHFRKALASSIDKDTFVKNNLNNGSKATNILTAKDFIKSKDGKDYTEGIKDGVAYNKENAKKELEAAKKELGQDKFEINFLTYDQDTALTQAEFIKAQVEKNLPGVTLKIKQLPFKQKLKEETKLNFDISMGGWGPDYPDPTTYLDLFRSDSQFNQTGFSDPAYDKALDDANSDEVLKDPAKRFEVLRGAEDKLLENSPIVPLFQKGGAGLKRQYIKNFEYHKFGGDYSLKEVELSDK